MHSSDWTCTYQELVKGVVAKLGGGEQEAGLQHADGRAGRDGVKVLDPQLCHRVPIIRQRDLV